MAEVGLDDGALELLVQRPAPVPGHIRRRIHSKVHRRLRPKRAPRWAVAAVSAVMVGLLGTVAVAASPALQAQLQRLTHWIPGLGLAEADGDSLVLAKPMSLQGATRPMTITGAVSNGKETQVRVRVDGAVAMEEFTHTPARLLLPDGSSLPYHTARSSSVDGAAVLNYWFPPVPAGTTQLKLWLPGFDGQAAGLEVEIPLVPAAQAGAKMASVSPAAVESKGARISVPAYVIEGDQVQLQLDIRATQASSRVLGAAGNPWARLVDNLGNEFQLERANSWVSRSLSGQRFSPSQLTFKGPIAKGATGLTLRITDLLVEQPGSAEFRVPLADLEEGVPFPVNQDVVLGDRRIKVKEVTRLSDGKFRLGLDIGILYSVSIVGLEGHVSNTDLRNGFADVTYAPSGEELALRFERPVLKVRGDWQLEIPLP